MLPSELGMVEVRSMSFSPSVAETAEQFALASEKALVVIRVTYTAIGGLFIVAGVALFVIGSLFLAIAPMVLILGTFIMALGVFAKQFILFVSKLHIIGDQNTNLYVPRTIIANDEFVRLEYETGMLLQVPWHSIRKVRFQNLTAYLMVSKQQHIIVPERAFPGSEGWSAFLNLCKRKVADSNLQPSRRI